jgi:hypothetical protein
MHLKGISLLTYSMHKFYSFEFFSHCSTDFALNSKFYLEKKNKNNNGCEAWIKSTESERANPHTHINAI